jgi:hypothetical protein
MYSPRHNPAECAHSSVEDVQFAGDAFSAQRAQIELIAAQLSMHQYTQEVQLLRIMGAINGRAAEREAYFATSPMATGNECHLLLALHAHLQGGGDAEVRASASSYIIGYGGEHCTEHLFFSSISFLSESVAIRFMTTARDLHSRR